MTNNVLLVVILCVSSEERTSVIDVDDCKVSIVENGGTRKGDIGKNFGAKQRAMHTAQEVIQNAEDFHSSSSGGKNSFSKKNSRSKQSNRREKDSV